MSNLALLGGEKSHFKGYKDYAAPIVKESAYPVVESMMRNGEISISGITDRFEQKFSQYFGTKYAVCESSGTCAIQAGLYAVGVGAGDEVIVPSYTFWASVGPVVACNAIPVFAEVDADSFTLSAKTVEACITPRTKAIIVVHVWGTPCDMDPILALAKKHNIKVVEDCSHAHGATYKGKKAGSLGDVGCFSMQGSKILAAGEGGVLVTDNKEYFERALALGHYNRLGALDDDSEYKKYAHTGFGFKHRAHPLGIAIADAALDELDKDNRTRNANALYLEKLIADIDCIKPQAVPENAERVFAYHYMRYIPEKFHGIKLVTLLKAFAAEGLVCGSCGYGHLHKEPFYTEKRHCGFNCPHYKSEFTLPEELPVTESLAENTFMVAPRFEIADKADIEKYAASLRKVFDNYQELLAYERENDTEQIKNDGRSINLFK